MGLFNRHIVGRWLCIAAALAMLLTCLVAPLEAQSSIRVISTQQSYVFSQSLTFGIQAQAEHPITTAILFFGREGTPLLRRVYPAFTPALEVRISHVEELESGQFAPGTTLRWWWELRDQAGARLVTDPATFEYTDTNQDWSPLEGPRVDLFSYAKDVARGRELLDKAEQALTRLEQDIGVTVEQRVRVYVYSNQRDMRVALAERSAGYDDRVTTLGVAVDEHTLLLLGSHPDAAATLAHELSHIVVGMATDNPYTGLPRWLDEGLAMYAEESLPASNRRAVQEAVCADDLFTLRSMTSYTGQVEKVDLYYGQAFSVVEFMVREFGRDKMRELLGVFAEGARQEDALQRVYGFGVDDLESRWRASLATLAQACLTPTPTLMERPLDRGDVAICLSVLGALGILLVGGLWWLRRRRRRARSAL
jgi:hypothetical protein